MFKVPMQSKTSSMFIRRQCHDMINTRRLLSTQNKPQVRQAGLSKTTLITLAAAGAGALYYQQRTKEDKKLYDGDLDPYEHTKQIGDKVIYDKGVIKNSRGVGEELNAAGEHVRSAAQLTGQVAQDAFNQAQKEGHAVANDIKRDAHNLRVEADKFAAEHHLKEGDRSPEDVLSHTSDEVLNVTENIQYDADAGGFNVADKFKEAKESVSSELHKAGEYVKDHGHGSVASGASIAHGNPMVYEKHSVDKTKPGWETRMEEYAQSEVHDTSPLVGKDTEKVRGVWEDKVNRDRGHLGLAAAEETSSSFWSILFGQTKDTEQKVEQRLEKEVKKGSDAWEDVQNKITTTAQDIKDSTSEVYQESKGKVASEANHIESSWNKVKSQVKDDANAAIEKVSDAASNVSEKFKRETDKAASGFDQVQRDVENKGSQLRRDISERLQDEKDRAKDSWNDLHKEVSNNAEKLKNRTEQTATSWYTKGTEQVKSGFTSVKDATDRDIQWAEEKVQDGLSSAKEEVDRLFGSERPKEKGYTDHVLRGEKYAEEEEGHLRHNRGNTNLKPAEVIVQNAHGKDM